MVTYHAKEYTPRPLTFSDPHPMASRFAAALFAVVTLAVIITLAVVIAYV
jgi:hypothetical protein